MLSFAAQGRPRPVVEQSGASVPPLSPSAVTGSVPTPALPGQQQPWPLPPATAQPPPPPQYPPSAPGQQAPSGAPLDRKSTAPRDEPIPAGCTLPSRPVTLGAWDSVPTTADMDALPGEGGPPGGVLRVYCSSWNMAGKARERAPVGRRARRWAQLRRSLEQPETRPDPLSPTPAAAPGVARGAFHLGAQGPSLPPPVPPPHSAPAPRSLRLWPFTPPLRRAARASPTPQGTATCTASARRRPAWATAPLTPSSGRANAAARRAPPTLTPAARPATPPVAQRTAGHLRPLPLRKTPAGGSRPRVCAGGLPGAPAGGLDQHRGARAPLLLCPASALSPMSPA